MINLCGTVQVVNIIAETIKIMNCFVIMKKTIYSRFCLRRFKNSGLKEYSIKEDY